MSSTLDKFTFGCFSWFGSLSLSPRTDSRDHWLCVHGLACTQIQLGQDIRPAAPIDSSFKLAALSYVKCESSGTEVLKDLIENVQKYWRTH